MSEAARHFDAPPSLTAPRSVDHDRKQSLKRAIGIGAIISLFGIGAGTAGAAVERKISHHTAKAPAETTIDQPPANRIVYTPENYPYPIDRMGHKIDFDETVNLFSTPGTIANPDMAVKDLWNNVLHATRIAEALAGSKVIKDPDTASQVQNDVYNQVIDPAIFGVVEPPADLLPSDHKRTFINTLHDLSFDQTLTYIDNGGVTPPKSGFSLLSKPFVPGESVSIQRDGRTYRYADFSTELTYNSLRDPRMSFSGIYDITIINDGSKWVVGDIRAAQSNS